MKIKPLIEAEAELTHSGEDAGPIVLSSRVRVARNLAQYHFPNRAKESQRQEIMSLCLEAASSVEAFAKGITLRMAELKDLEKQILVERHLISRELMSAKNGAGVRISRDQSRVLMINEEDHLRLQMLGAGFKLHELWNGVDTLDSALEEKLDYAFSAELGYLTACPTNLGTALRASAMLHLPVLVLSGQMEKVIRAVSQLGMTVRGLFGEGTDATGSIFQISNQQTLGESEEEILKRLDNVLHSVVDQETNARLKFFKEKKDRLMDRIARAAGVLRHSRMLSSDEAMNLLSFLRLAVDLKLLPETSRALMDRLFILSQPGHIQYAAGKADSAARDLHRARFMREQTAAMPPLNFDVSP